MAENQAGDVQAIVQLVRDREIRKIQAVIQVRYGFRPTRAYAADLLAFVDALTQGVTDEPGE